MHSLLGCTLKVVNCFSRQSFVLYLVIIFFSLQMEKALANMALKTAEIACVKEPKSVPPMATTPTETPSALKGVSQSLLERVGHNVLEWIAEDTKSTPNSSPKALL